MWLLLMLILAGEPQEAPPSPPPLSIAEYGQPVRARNAAAAATPETPIPERAFSSPQWWEQNQCGAEPSDACLRTARNRLAMARVERMEIEAAQPPAPGTRPAAQQNCRMVTRRAESGFGGSFTRVCGDDASAERALDAHQAMMDDLRERTTPQEQTCDRPLSTETQEQWIGRCSIAPR